MVLVAKRGKKKRRVPKEVRIIGENLRRFRHRAGLSQTDVGESLSVSFQQIQKYESGTNRLPIEKLYILKHIYDVPYEYFFVGLEGFLLRNIL